MRSVCLAAALFLAPSLVMAQDTTRCGWESGQWVCRTDKAPEPVNPMGAFSNSYRALESTRPKPQAPASPPEGSMPPKRSTTSERNEDAQVTAALYILANRCDLAAVVAHESGDRLVMQKVLSACIIEPAIRARQ